jgi:hypothetical protein
MYKHFMKRALCLLAAGTLITCPVIAQDSAADVVNTTTGTNTEAKAGGPLHHHRFLTKEELTELQTAHDEALKSNPDLDAEGKELMKKQEEYRKKLHDAMVKADPKVEPILAKMHDRPPGGPGGPPPPDDGN